MRATWQAIPLRAIFRRRVEDDRPDLPLLSVYRDLGIVPREGREDNYNRPSEDLTSYQVVRPGDLVMNKMKTWQGSIGISDYHGIVSPAYFVADQVGEADSRFLHHLLRSGPLIAQYGARSKGIRPAQWDLPWESFREIVIRLPSAREQRAIADFLDAETARIDAVLSKRQRILALAIIRAKSEVQHFLNDEGCRTSSVKLGQAVERLIDYRGATPEKSDDGVPLLTASNMIDDGIDFEVSRQFIPERLYGEWMRRGIPRAGDVLLTTEAPLGHVAMMSNQKVALAQRLILLRARVQCVDPEYLYAYLASARGQTELLSRASGSTVSGLRTDRLRDVPVMVPARSWQRRIAGRFLDAKAERQRLRVAVDRQVALLKEHRQALIAAAVSGEIDVSTASGRGVPA